MKLKKIILVLILFLITGCTTNYNLSLNADSSINEEAIIKIENTENNYEKILKLIDNINVPKKNYKISRTSENIIVIYNKKYESIEEFELNSFVYKQVFNDIQIDKTISKTTLETEVNFNNNNLSINKDNQINMDEMVINIKSELPIIKENSDSKEKNVYTWHYNGEKKEEKIIISYSNKPSIITYKSILITISIIICSLLIGTIIYRRVKQKQAI